MINKNAFTGLGNCKKTTRHHVHLSLCAKSRKTNDAKSRKLPKTSIWAIFGRFRSQISPNCSFFWKIGFLFKLKVILSTNFRPKTKKLLELFLRKISKVSGFGLIWRRFREYLQIKSFFSKNPALSLFYLYSSLTSCRKSEKSLEPFLRKLRYQPTNYYQQHQSCRTSLTPAQK